MALKVELSANDIVKVIKAFRDNYNYDFSHYAELSFKRRIEYLLISHNLYGVDDLVERTARDEKYFKKCINDITVNTTELFRDADVWLNLKQNVFPLFKDKSSINIWHAGCSSGEEVYSTLILLNEMNLLEKVKVLGTDINTDILEIAKKGVFNRRLNNGYFENYNKVLKTNNSNYQEAPDLPVKFSKYFESDDSGKSIKVKKFIRDKATFRFHNLVDGSVLSRFDLIFCRNVIIYFNPVLQNKVIKKFHESLFHQGMLLVGIHENISYLPVGSKFEARFMKGLYVKKIIRD
ncbi:MAG: protein-glutamate O-methyltransferase CheR [Bacteroidales bacterium]